MPVVSTAKMTAWQFLELGEDPPGIHLELVNGEVAASPSAVPSHSYIEKMLSFFLAQHIRQHRLGRLYGDVDTIFGRHDVRRPDLIFFRADRVHLVGKKAMEGPPDLCRKGTEKTAKKRKGAKSPEIKGIWSEGGGIGGRRSKLQNRADLAWALRFAALVGHTPGHPAFGRSNPVRTRVNIGLHGVRASLI